MGACLTRWTKELSQDMDGEERACRILGRVWFERHSAEGFDPSGVLSLIEFQPCLYVITPHAQRERGKIIGVGVHIHVYVYIIICICGQKKNLNRTLAIDYLNICSRTIYRLALPLLSPETLSSLRNSLSKLRIFLFNADLALFVRRMTQLRPLNSIGKYRHLVN